MRVGDSARRGSGSRLDGAAIAGHLQQLAAPCVGPGIVGEERDQARGVSLDGRDAMNRVSSLEEKQRAGMHRDPHHAFSGTYSTSPPASDGRSAIEVTKSV